jgi:4-diphosphocytidyl-2-C-methyl-D-erythritol kinase
MISFPICKINIGLQITGRFDDGYHSIETCMYPLPLNDVLEIVPALANETRILLSGSAEVIPAEKNIVFKAWKLLHERFDIPFVDIYLHKVIPSGAGLGGGSADGAYALNMLNSMFELGLSTEQLETEAANLGMDCPFFIAGSPAIATGKGEILNPVPIDLSGYYLVLAKPPVNVSTAEAYAGVIPQKPEKNIAELIKLPVEEWGNVIVNDFERTVFAKYPFIETIKTKIYSKGAVYAQMSGSGSAVFGLFRSKPDFNGILDDCFVFESLLGSFSK